MKLPITVFKFVPKSLAIAGGYNLCVYGKPDEEVQEWINHWNIPTSYDTFTNIKITNPFSFKEIFRPAQEFSYVDGFSPNLNKHLHVGHLSNLILAKAFQNMQVGKKFISIFGDTLTGDVDKQDALWAYEMLCNNFNYKVNQYYFASEMQLNHLHVEEMLKDGEGDYANTKVFEIGEEKIVGIKSDGTTSYFYQDVALALELGKPTLYLTGQEQNNHFNLLKKLFPWNSHIGLGLVLLDGKKMSSSEGNVIFAQDLINQLLEGHDGDKSLVYNILAGIMLNSSPSSNKNIDTKTINNVKLSKGLYVSYTMARMHSAGVELIPATYYDSTDLALHSFKAKYCLSPNILFEGLINQCEKIKGSEENKRMFQALTGDMVKAAYELGFQEVTKV